MEVEVYIVLDTVYLAAFNTVYAARCNINPSYDWYLQS
jgi:hypothetical protein